MKWSSAARIVINRLVDSGRLKESDRSDLVEMIGNHRGNEAFKRTEDILSNQGWRIGWNKFWQGQELFGWYGETVTRQPLRLVALEIENHPKRCADVCQWIISLPHPRVVRAEASKREEPAYSMKVPNTSSSIADLLNEVSPMLGVASPRTQKPIHEPPQINLSIKASPVSEVSAPAKVLGNLGIDVAHAIRDKDRMRILQRINLDRRDQPFIEQWRWNSSAGMAMLSDGGRIDVKPEVIWTNAVEKALSLEIEFDQQLIDFLNSIDGENLEIPLVELPDRSGALNAMLEYLEECQYARVMFDRIRFRAKQGDFPRRLADLYNSVA